MFGKFITSLALFALGLAGWAYGNIWIGNLGALDAFAPWLPEVGKWFLALLPSAGQAWVTERWGRQGAAGDDGPEVQASGLIVTSLALFSTLLDLALPALGMLVVWGIPVNGLGIGIALVLALVASWLCQHIWWSESKNLLIMARWFLTRPRRKPHAAPTKPKVIPPSRAERPKPKAARARPAAKAERAPRLVGKLNSKGKGAGNA